MTVTVPFWVLALIPLVVGCIWGSVVARREAARGGWFNFAISGPVIVAVGLCLTAMLLALDLGRRLN